MITSDHNPSNKPLSPLPLSRYRIPRIALISRTDMAFSPTSVLPPGTTVPPYHAFGSSSAAAAAAAATDLYHTRFEIECEFVSCLANPYYLQYLAAEKYFDDPRFVRYLRYLLYWRTPPYLQYLSWPGPTLRHLELLQEESFRQAIISPEVVSRLEQEGIQAGFRWAQG